MRTRRWMLVLVAVAVLVAAGVATVLVGRAVRDDRSYLEPMVGTWDLEDPGFPPVPQSINLVVEPDESFTLTLYGGRVRCTGVVAHESDERFRFDPAGGPCSRFTATLLGGADRLRVDWYRPGGSDNDTLVLRDG